MTELTQEQLDTLKRVKARQGETTPAPWTVQVDGITASVDGQLVRVLSIDNAYDENYGGYQYVDIDNLDDLDLITDAPALQDLVLTLYAIVTEQAARIKELESEDVLGERSGYYCYRPIDIEYIANIVKHDMMGLSPISPLNDINFKQREVIEQAIAYLQRIIPDAQKLTEQFELLLGYRSISGRILEAFNMIYSGDIELNHLTSMLNRALTDDNHKNNLMALAKSKYAKDGVGWAYLDTDSYSTGWSPSTNDFFKESPKDMRMWVIYGELNKNEPMYHCSWQGSNT